MLVYAIRRCPNMERDMDLVRDLLLKIAANREMDGTCEFMYETPQDLGISGHSLDEVAYHIRLLIDEQFVKGCVTTAFPMHIISSLTWDGHDFR